MPSPVLRGTNAPREAELPLAGLTADGGASAEETESGDDAQADNPQCAAFAADRDADVGDIMRAGCTPTLAQMSALMDNPLGNVAMLFTQFDVYQLKEPNTGRTEDKYNYMGIAQFPKGLGENCKVDPPRRSRHQQDHQHRQGTGALRSGGLLLGHQA